MGDRTLRALLPPPVWVDPDHTLATAGHLMRGYGLRAIGVARGGRLVGILHAEVADAAPEGWLVRDAMHPAPPELSADADPREAAEVLLNTRSSWLATTDEGRHRGVIEVFDLLSVLGSSQDALTGLAGSDEMRRWATHRLAEGEEIAVIFVDLDQFGALNKRFGHAEGDRALRALAAHLEALTLPSRDFLCRFGGDEFALATLRPRAAAEGLAAAFGRALDVEGIGPVRFSVGIAGGRREAGRTDTHPAATVDDLVNQASLASTAAKEVQLPLGGVKIRVIGVYSGPVATVVLGQGDHVFSGTDSGAGRDEDRVARAAAKALSRRVAGMELVVERLAVVAVDGRSSLNLSGELRFAGRARALRIAKTSDREPILAVAEAVVESVLAEVPEAATA